MSLPDDLVQQCIDYYNNVLVEHFDKNKNRYFSSYQHNRVSTNLLLATSSPHIQNSVLRCQVQCEVIPLISQPLRLTILLFSKDR